MTRYTRTVGTVSGLLLALCAVPLLRAQKEFPPPQGNGHVVVLASGKSGPDHYEKFAKEIAAQGYDVVLVDSRPMKGTSGAGLKAVIPQAQQMPHALPGKVALVCNSLGGAICLGYGSMWPDLVAVDIVWYPATTVFPDVPGFVARMKVPTLMFAGEKDDADGGCCTIEKARAFASASASAPVPFEVVTYPNTNHDFIVGGEHYNAGSYKDAFARTLEKLKTAAW
jgi:dienelactone hydrolase